MKTALLLAMALVLCAPLAAAAGTIELPKTGQTTQYETGDDGDLQKGVAWPSPRFTDHGNGTITDSLTGLMWTKNANLPGGYRTWYQAMDYVAGMNSGSGTYGYTDWRLPNLNELESLINAEVTDSATWLNSQGFTNVQSSGYWSSTTHAVYTDGAWIVGMGYGNVYGYFKSGFISYVWPVRAGQ